MTYADEPFDINVRLTNIDEQLEQLGEEIDLIRTVQNANRREMRASSQTVGRLERTVTQLADIARSHQQALRISQENIDRVWQYLESQIRNNGNGNNS